MKVIDRDIKSGEFQRVYLFCGEEKYLLLEYENKLRNAVMPKEAELMNLVKFDGVDDVEKVASAVETLPFFSPYRLVLIKDSGLFKTGKKEMTDKMCEVIKNIPSSCVVVFTNEEVDKRNSLYKAVKKYGYVCEIKTLKDSELIKWVEVNSLGKIKGSTAAYFVQNVGNQIEALKAEMDKAISYSGDKAVTKEVIDNICTKSLESGMFDMMDSIGLKKADKALDIYNNMLFMKQSPVAVLTMIARQFKLILQCKYLLKKGYTKSQIALELSLRDFMVEKYINQSKNFSVTTLMEAVKDCAELDVRFKQGLISDVLGVEMIILKYSR
ncbi:MAG: DNA polymerase III subunit delta [Lachnospirales bacterium]